MEFLDAVVHHGGPRRNSFNVESKPSISIAPDGSVKVTKRGSLGNETDFLKIDVSPIERGSRLSLCALDAPQKPENRRGSYDAPMPSQGIKDNETKVLSGKPQVEMRRGSYDPPRITKAVMATDTERKRRGSFDPPKPEKRRGSYNPPAVPSIFVSPTRNTRRASYQPVASKTSLMSNSIGDIPKETINDCGSDTIHGLSVDNPSYITGSFLSLNLPCGVAEEVSLARSSSACALRDALLEADPTVIGMMTYCVLIIMYKLVGPYQGPYIIGLVCCMIVMIL